LPSGGRHLDPRQLAQQIGHGRKLALLYLAGRDDAGRQTGLLDRGRLACGRHHHSFGKRGDRQLDARLRGGAHLNDGGLELGGPHHGAAAGRCLHGETATHVRHGRAPGALDARPGHGLSFRVDHDSAHSSRLPGHAKRQDGCATKRKM
jgi:hypothetical protein